MSLLAAAAAAAQTHSPDARSIALGGASNAQNVAVSLIESPRPYGRAVIPLGLLQLLTDLDAFDPASDGYDPVLSLDYAANPLHFTFGRGRNSPGRRFFGDLARGTLNPDLASYRGFSPAVDVVAEGLVFPSIGRTVPLWRGAAFHGIYLGVGPYLGARTSGVVDPDLARVFANDATAVPAGRAFVLGSRSINQLALGATVGYRARLPLPRSDVRSGAYLGANVHYLHGLWLDDFDVRMQLTTDENGLIEPNASLEAVTIDRLSSSSGRGVAVDLGAAAVIGPWQVGVGANGIANRIRWRKLEGERLVRPSVIGGGSYLEEPLQVGGERELRLPIDYVADVSYHAPTWSALAEYGHGFLGSRIHAGLERRFRWVEVRGGLRFIRETWHPSIGMGFNTGRNLGVDVALFTLASSLEQHRQAALAISLRFAGTSR